MPRGSEAAVLDVLTSFRVDTLPAVLVATSVPALLFLVLLLAPARRQGGAPRRAPGSASWLRYCLIALGIGAALGIVVSIVVVDMLDVFGVPVALPVRLAVALALGMAAVGLAVLLAPAGRRPGAARRATAAVLVVTAALSGAVGVNAGFGKYRTLGDLVPPQPVDIAGGGGGALPVRVATGDAAVSAAAWSPPADLPAAGTLLSVEIPGAVSGFPARPASLYLPPAALVTDPPALPVMVLLSGQPGDPTDMLVAGQFRDALDAFAAAHGGLAPIVVSPDQLSAEEVNPLCIDGPLGASKTYLETDVPAWILHNLNVATGRLAWAFGGYSQGGTCTFQIGLDDPARYGTDVVVAAELAPEIGDQATTLAQGFGGDRAAMDAAQPLQVLARNAPYRDTLLIQGTGSEDVLFSAWADQLQAAAQGAGVETQRVTSPGTAHDFNSVRYTLDHALPVFADRSGLTSGAAGSAP